MATLTPYHKRSKKLFTDVIFPMTTQSVRPPAVAGMFYPDDPRELTAAVTHLLGEVSPQQRLLPKVLIAPHAGYVYSGGTAAHAYRLLQATRHIRRVILAGPAHRAYVDGMAFPSVAAFATPLGNLPLDREAIDQALRLPHTCIDDAAHAQEHCLEVHLPFLQTVLHDITLTPFLVGQCSAADVARVFDNLWGGDETLIVVSSDLSHFLPYAQALSQDANTTRKIENHDTHLVGEEACGAHAINGLMYSRNAQALSVHTLATCNSGDTAGDHTRVVGYGAYALA